MAMNILSSQCFSLSAQLRTLSLSSSSRPSSFSLKLRPSPSLFSQGRSSLRPLQRSGGSRIVCEAAVPQPADSAAKRFRQSVTRRMRNKSRKTQYRTCMKKVFKALLKIKKKKDAQPEEILPIEALISDAYQAIDKAAIRGVLHKNTAANRKSRLARNKRAILIFKGWYKPAPEPVAA